MIEVFGVSFDDLFEVEVDAPGGSDPSFEAAISDRYLIDEEIGQGGMGTVYLARDVKLGRQVAIKVVSPEVVSGIGMQQFLKEARYTARLQHQNILGLYDAGEAAGHPYYVMPYIKGGSLRQLLERRGRLPLHEALRIARGIANALDYAHKDHVYSRPFCKRDGRRKHLIGDTKGIHLKEARIPAPELPVFTDSALLVFVIECHGDQRGNRSHTKHA